MKSSDARHDAAPTRRRRTLAWLVGVLGVTLALAMVGGSFYAWRTWSSVSAIERSPDLLPAEEPAQPDVPPRPEPTASAPGALNYVLMGSDSLGSHDRGRSDVLMLAHVTPNRDRVYLISFTRDMWVDIPGHGRAKINAAYAYGGEALAVRTIESLIGVRVDHAAVVDFAGFAGLTQALGGVTIDNQIASTSAEGFTWPRGEVTLAGEEALSYVRQRYELPHGDLDRADRQRTVVRAALSKLSSAGVLANPVQFSDLVGLLGQYVTVDAGLTNEELFTTATSLHLRGSEDIRTLQAPIAGFATSADGQAINLVDEAGLAELAQAIQTGTMDAYWDAHPSA